MIILAVALMAIGIVLVVGSVVCLAIARSQPRMTPMDRARTDYLTAEHKVHQILTDARRKMYAVTRKRSSRYNPDLGSWREWM
jgi:hypothetical protein